MDVPYRVVAGQLCYEGTLTLSDGVQIYMSPGYPFTNSCASAVVYGNLVVEGTTKGVLLTSAAAGGYEAKFTKVTNATRINGLTVENAATGVNMVAKSGETITLDNLTVKTSSQHGVSFDTDGNATDAQLVINGCTITQPAQYGVKVTDSGAMTLKNCVIDQATDWGIYPTASANTMTVSIENTTVKNTLKKVPRGGVGIALPTSGVTMGSWAKNTFTGNTRYPVSLGSADMMYALDTASTYTGNASGFDYVLVTDMTLASSGTIPKLDVPYYWSAEDSSGIATGGTMKIGTSAAATEVVVDGAAVRVKAGAFGIKVGENASMTTVLNAKNGASFLPFNSTTKGAWQGLWFDSKSTGSILDDVYIAYGGKSYSANGYTVAANIWVYPSGTSGPYVTVQNSDIQNSASLGIRCKTTGCTDQAIGSGATANDYTGCVSGGTN
jgi:hypothetical protein